MDRLRKKIGQMFVVGCGGESLDREERLLFEAYGFGGFILFKKNCAEPGQIVSLCRSLWDNAGDLPPFIAIDQEGGRVHRLPEAFTHFPSAAWIGAQKNRALAQRLGRASADQLALAGINLDFAPVLDVNSSPANPVIGDRSFGSTADEVIAIASAWTAGLRDGGIIPCAKHFPGHGDTDKDSHLDLPIVGKSLDQLKAVELPPFVHACAKRIESLMTAHVLYPALDAKLPATLSEPIVTGLLRHQLGYDGVLFSDDMAMKAIADRFGQDDAVTLAVSAGIDVMLFCHELESAVHAFEHLCNEAEKDPAIRARIDNSHRRVSALKRRYLKKFTGVASNEIAARLAELNHQQLVGVNFGDG